MKTFPAGPEPSGGSRRHNPERQNQRNRLEKPATPEQAAPQPSPKDSRNPAPPKDPIALSPAMTIARKAARQNAGNPSRACNRERIKNAPINPDHFPEYHTTKSSMTSACPPSHQDMADFIIANLKRNNQENHPRRLRVRRPRSQREAAGQRGTRPPSLPRTQKPRRGSRGQPERADAGRTPGHCSPGPPGVPNLNRQKNGPHPRATLPKGPLPSAPHRLAQPSPFPSGNPKPQPNKKGRDRPRKLSSPGTGNQPRPRPRDQNPFTFSQTISQR